MLENKEFGLQFPTEFPMKVIGWNNDDFEEFVVRIVAKHVPYMDAGKVSARESSAGKYLSVTLTFIAQSREQVDAIYRELTSHKQRVLFIL